MDKTIIYTSQLLGTRKKTQSVAIAIDNALKKLHVQHEELSFTKDIWCRDYMPVMVFDDGIYAKYVYRPDYLLNDPKDKQYITNQEDACRELNLFTPSNMNIIFDGGNYVRCGNKVIMTDKIFSENPKWPAKFLLQHLTDTLCAEIILLPWDMEEDCGHSDGMVAPLDDERILLNGCWDNKRGMKFHKRLMKILEPHFKKVEVLPCDITEDKDAWCYINFLKVADGILLPCLSKDFKCPTDRAALTNFKRLFPNMDEDKIIQIYAEPLIRGKKTGGGALHCVTWEYIEKSNHSI